MKLYCILMVENVSYQANATFICWLPPSLPLSRGLFFINNTEALSMMDKKREFDAEDLIRVVSALGEIKKKKEEKKESEKTLEMMLKASLLTPLVEANS